MKAIARLIAINSLSLFLASLFLPGLKINGEIITFIYAGAILAIISTLIDPIVKLLTLPFHILTLGLLSFLTTLVSLFLITIFYKDVRVSDFTFGGISVLGLTIDKVFVSGFLSFVVISATIYLLNKLINWVFSK